MEIMLNILKRKLAAGLALLLVTCLLLTGCDLAAVPGNQPNTPPRRRE